MKKYSSGIIHTTEDVYVGIDVHKKSYAITAWIEGTMVKRATLPADPQNLARSLKTWFKNTKIHSVYEAGFSGFGLHRQLVNEDIHNIVVNAASIEVAPNDRKKTDRRD